MAEYYIYSIKNEKNGKLYIGSSMQLKRRWITHRSELKRNIHPNEHLQRSYNKHGKDVFVYSIIQSGINDKLECKNCEDHFIEKFNTLNNSHGYNKAYSNFESSPMLESVKLKISKSLKNNKSICKSVIQYDIHTGKKIKTWISASDVARELFNGKCQSNISACCRGKCIAVKGFGFCFESEFDCRMIDPTYKQVKHSHNRETKIKQIFKSGKENVYNSIKEAIEATGFSYKVISRCVAGHRKLAYNCKWEYLKGI